MCNRIYFFSQSRNSIMIKEEYLKHVHFHQKYTHAHLENGIVGDLSDPSKNSLYLLFLFDKYYLSVPLGNIIILFIKFVFFQREIFLFT